MFRPHRGTKTKEQKNQMPFRIDLNFTLFIIHFHYLIFRSGLINVGFSSFNPTAKIGQKKHRRRLRCLISPFFSHRVPRTLVPALVLLVPWAETAIYCPGGFGAGRLGVLDTPLASFYLKDLVKMVCPSTFLTTSSTCAILPATIAASGTGL